MLIAPFPGMREMAVFSSAGLIFSFITVILFYPQLLRQPIRSLPHSRLLVWMNGYREFWERSWGLWGPFALVSVAGLIVLGGLRMSADDDIRLLQSQDPQAVKEERFVRDLVGQTLASQLFIVEAASEAQLLERQERLIAELGELEAKGVLAGHMAFADWLPSPARQTENRALLRAAILGDDSLLWRIAEQVGLPRETVRSYIDAFAMSADEKPVQLSAWLENPISQPLRSLWLGRIEGREVAAVGLMGIRDPESLQALEAPDRGVIFYDGVGELSDLFGHYRRQTAWLMAGSYLVIALLLITRYGLRGGVAVMIAPFAATVISFAALGLLGEAVSLFNIMGILLVLGIGIDYSIFFRETGSKDPSTLAAIALSFVTTLLAFGLLSLSSTRAVHAFGLTVLIGISVAFLLSPTAGWGRSNVKAEPNT